MGVRMKKKELLQLIEELQQKVTLLEAQMQSKQDREDTPAYTITCSPPSPEEIDAAHCLTCIDNKCQCEL
jgi:cell division septum initiation protein DivIVA